MKFIVVMSPSKILYSRVDDEDYPILAPYRWRLRYSGNITYATRMEGPKKARRSVLMHRQIMGNPEGLDVDHIDCDGLNNQKDNLRVATRQQNLANQRNQVGTSSKYKGVSIVKAGCWRAYIKKDRRFISLGWHPTEEQAALAYNAAAQRIYGEFARLNEVVVNAV